MERILIVDSDRAHSTEVEQVLRCAGYETKVCTEASDAVQILKDDSFDVVVVVPRSKAMLHDDLMSLCPKMKYLNLQPDLLFLLRWKPSGPAERLLGDRWNVQVQYER